MAKNKKTDFGYIEEAVLDIEVEPAPELKDYPKRAAARRKAREQQQTSKEPAEQKRAREPEEQPNYLSGPSVGVLFRQARLKLKRDVNEIAQMLRIRKEYLQAIEDGRYGDLPGHTYAVGFVRAYAGNLGLDPEEIVQKFKEETGNVDPQPELIMPTPVQESRSSGLGILVVLAVLGGVLYGAWHFLAPKDEGGSSGGAASTAASTAGEAGTAGASSTASEGSSGASTSTGGGSTGEAGSSGSTSTGTAGEASGGTGSMAETASGGTASGSTADGGSGGSEAALAGQKVVLTATGDAWIRISDAQGRILLQRILRRGATYEVPSEQSGLVLLVGNAGALEASVGGKTLGKLGPNGIVRRNIPLDPEKLAAAIKAP